MPISSRPLLWLRQPPLLSHLFSSPHCPCDEAWSLQAAGSVLTVDGTAPSKLLGFSAVLHHPQHLNQAFFHSTYTRGTGRLRTCSWCCGRNSLGSKQQSLLLGSVVRDWDLFRRQRPVHWRTLWASMHTSALLWSRHGVEVLNTSAGVTPVLRSCEKQSSRSNLFFTLHLSQTPKSVQQASVLAARITCGSEPAGFLACAMRNKGWDLIIVSLYLEQGRIPGNIQVLARLIAFLKGCKVPYIEIGMKPRIP